MYRHLSCCQHAQRLLGYTVALAYGCPSCALLGSFIAGSVSTFFFNPLHPFSTLNEKQREHSNLTKYIMKENQEYHKDQLIYLSRDTNQRKEEKHANSDGIDVSMWPRHRP